jgi:hypothetical protein
MAAGRIGNGRVRIAAMGRIELMRGVVGDPSQHQPGTLMAQHHMFVHQHGHAQAADFVDPFVGIE